MFLQRREGSIFRVKSKRKYITIGYFNCYKAMNKALDWVWKETLRVAEKEGQNFGTVFLFFRNTS